MKNSIRVGLVLLLVLFSAGCVLPGEVESDFQSTPRYSAARTCSGVPGATSAGVVPRVPQVPAGSGDDGRSDDDDSGDCASQGSWAAPVGAPVGQVSACSVERISGGVRITCGNTSEILWDGARGERGADGAGCTVQRVPGGALIRCGSTQQIVYDGRNGTSCTTVSFPDGAEIVCSDGSRSRIYDGQDGRNGTNGTNGTNGGTAPPSAFTIVEIIDPCGPNPGYYFNEVLLRLANGDILGYFESGTDQQNHYLTKLVPGSYYTTDEQHCRFWVSSGMQVYW